MLSITHSKLKEEITSILPPNTKDTKVFSSKITELAKRIIDSTPESHRITLCNEASIDPLNEKDTTARLVNSFIVILMNETIVNAKFETTFLKQDEKTEKKSHITFKKMFDALQHIDLNNKEASFQALAPMYIQMHNMSLNELQLLKKEAELFHSQLSSKTKQVISYKIQKIILDLLNKRVYEATVLSQEKLSDVQKELFDKRKELFDKRKELFDKRKELFDKRKELFDAKNNLTKAREKRCSIQ